jgi:hypothetical protein
MSTVGYEKKNGSYVVCHICSTLNFPLKITNEINKKLRSRYSRWPQSKCFCKFSYIYLTSMLISKTTVIWHLATTNFGEKFTFPFHEKRLRFRIRPLKYQRMNFKIRFMALLQCGGHKFFIRCKGDTTFSGRGRA